MKNRIKAGLSFTIAAGAVASLIFGLANQPKLTRVDAATNLGSVKYLAVNDANFYKDNNSLFNIQKLLVNYNNKNITCIVFDTLEQKIINILSEFKNLNIVKASISTSFIDNINQCDSVILMLRLNETDANLYKSVKETLNIRNKQILKEILV